MNGPILPDRRRSGPRWSAPVAAAFLAVWTGVALAQSEDLAAVGPLRPVTIPHCRVKLINDVQLAGERMGILAYVAAEGTRVPAGQTVAQIRDDLVRIGLQIAEQEAANDIEIRFAEKAAELAQLKYVRALDANKRAGGTVSELELRELRLDAERALLQLEQARQRFVIAGLRRDENRELLEACRIPAPFDAVVLQVYKRPGEVVREGEPILEVANTDRVRIEGHLPVAEADRVQPGSRVEVILAAPDAGANASAVRFEGEIGFVDAKVEPVSRTVRVWAEVINRRDLLRDGLTATMMIHPR